MPSVYAEAQAFIRELEQLHAPALAAYEAELLRILPALEAQAAAAAERIAAMQASGATLTELQLFSRERARIIAAQVQSAVTRLSGGLAAPLDGAVGAALLQGVEAASALIGAQLPDGFPLAFARPNFGALQAALGAQQGAPLRELFNALGTDSGRMVRTALNAALVSGRNPRLAARTIQQVTDLSTSRAEVIARTETLRAYRIASLETYRASGITRWRRLAAKQVRSCAACLGLDGEEQDTDQVMATHPNCFTAGAVVSGPRAIASTSRWYEGEIVEVETASGHFLSVTPNHPILTTEGWIAAGLLNESSYVLGYSGPEGCPPGVHPDDYQVPARIEHVASAVGSAFGMSVVSVPVAAEDFHGDGGGSQVCVVRSYGLLGDALDTAFSEPNLKQQLGGRHMSLAEFTSLGNLAAMIEGVRLAAERSVRRRSQLAAFFGATLSGDQAICSRHAAALDTSRSEAGRYDVSGRAVTLGERILRRASKVGIDDLAFGDSQSLPLGSALLGTPYDLHRGAVAPDVTLAQGRAQTVIANVEARRSDFTALAVNVRPHRVINCRRRGFSGHVYNLETRVGWYVANGIISHNCRCTMVPIIEGVPQSRRETGSEWLARQSADVQRAVLGKGGFEAYQAGAPLSAFARVEYSREWGPTVRVASFKEIAA